MTKAELRRSYRQKRALLTETQINSFNVGILNQLLRFDWTGIYYIHTFLPIVGRNEPDMWSFITNTRVYFPHMQIVVSRSESTDNSMIHFLLTADTVLEKNAWGITEPVGGEVVSETLLDVVLVPLLVADRIGNRVGYGKGFYDRFLAKCRPDCKKIGISFFDPVEKIDDVDQLDVPLDSLITPKGTIQFVK